MKKWWRGWKLFLSDCEELVNWEVELDKKLNEKKILIEKQKQVLKQVAYDDQVENKLVVQNRELVHQKQLQKSHAVIELEKDLAKLVGKLEAKEEEINHLREQANKPIQDTVFHDSNTITKNLLLDKVVGRGAYGKVYLGKYRGEEAAIRKLDISFDSLSQDSLIAIKEKLNLLKKLNHSNIINFFGCEQKDNHLYLIMEYANQGSLADYINKHKEQNHDWKTNYQFIKQMATGLAYLHSQNIIHRDLKSANVLICHKVAKLADFGLAKTKTWQTKTNANNLVGTVAWMVPEVLNHSKPHTCQSDVYSLGMVIWEIVSKCTFPFKDTKNINDERFIIAAYLRGEREKIPADTPPVLKEIIEGCWKGQPEQRITLEQIEQKVNEMNQVTKRKAEEQLIKEISGQKAQIEIPPKNTH